LAGYIVVFCNLIGKYDDNLKFWPVNNWIFVIAVFVLTFLSFLLPENIKNRFNLRDRFIFGRKNYWPFMYVLLAVWSI